MDQSSFPKQRRADQDSRSDVDQDLPADQTRKEDEAYGDSCGSGRGGLNHRPKLKLKEEVDDVDDPSGKYYYEAKNKKNAQKNIMKRICCSIGSYFCIFNGKEEANGICSKRLRPILRRRILETKSGAKFDGYDRDHDSSKNDYIKIKTFQLPGGDGGCSGSTVADQGQGGSATTGSSDGAAK